MQGSQRMRSLIDDLLRYSQIGQKVRNLAPVDLNEVVQGVTQDLQLAINESGANVQVAELPIVVGDAAQLRHLFQNLIGNALKYRRPDVKPLVCVTARRDGSQWSVAVQDNGIGISSEYKDLVFAPFKRLHGQEIPGTGIGLAVCRRVVEAHQGQISLESTPGVGSTFRFTLPTSTYPWSDDV
jgi:light-regulated signal transduction histidine kinase (bacteriophytochrome)